LKKEIITGCEGRGDAESPYLTRWHLLKVRDWKLFLHKFHRSDADVQHDHPWNFWTLVLWRGYLEETPNGRRRVWPGQFLYRPATWIHRVELIREQPAWTLVIASPYKRGWGFWIDRKFVHFREYFRRLGC